MSRLVSRRGWGFVDELSPQRESRSYMSRPSDGTALREKPPNKTDALQVEKKIKTKNEDKYEVENEGEEAEMGFLGILQTKRQQMFAICRCSKSPRIPEGLPKPLTKYSHHRKQGFVIRRNHRDGLLERQGIHRGQRRDYQHRQKAPLRTKKERQTEKVAAARMVEPAAAAVQQKEQEGRQLAILRNENYRTHSHTSPLLRTPFSNNDL